MNQRFGVAERGRTFKRTVFSMVFIVCLKQSLG